MNLPVEVPGLDTIVPTVEEGTTLVVEGGPDLAKSFFVRTLCRTALHSRVSVCFVTSRSESEIRNRFTAENGGPLAANESPRIVERDVLGSLTEFVPAGGILVVDSFSFLTLELTPIRLARLLRDLERELTIQKATAVLTTDRGMFDERSEAVITHLGEGQIAFHAQEGTEGVVRFLRIPKWADGRFFDRNIYYEFDGKRIAIDLRNRVL